MLGFEAVSLHQLERYGRARTVILIPAQISTETRQRPRPTSTLFLLGKIFNLLFIVAAYLQNSWAPDQKNVMTGRYLNALISYDTVSNRTTSGGMFWFIVSLLVFFSMGSFLSNLWFRIHSNPSMRPPGSYGHSVFAAYLIPPTSLQNQSRQLFHNSSPQPMGRDYNSTRA